VSVFDAALEQAHTALKQHATALESALADRASSEMELDSVTRDKIGRRDRHAAELTERITQLEESLAKEQQAVKDVRAQVCSFAITAHR